MNYKTKPYKILHVQFKYKKYKILNTYASNLNSQVISGKINNLHINEDLIKKISLRLWKLMF